MVISDDYCNCFIVGEREIKRDKEKGMSHVIVMSRMFYERVRIGLSLFCFSWNDVQKRIKERRGNTTNKRYNNKKH